MNEVELHDIRQLAEQQRFALAASELSGLSPDQQAQLLEDLPATGLVSAQEAGVLLPCSLPTGDSLP